MAAPAPVLCDFERARAERVARNNAVLQSMVSTELRELATSPAPAPRRRRVSEVREPSGPPRRSVRAEGRPVVKYVHDLDEERERRPRHVGAPRYTRKRLTLEELEAMTEEEKEAVRPAACRRATAGAVRATRAVSRD